jgi:hypothetical protein
VHEFRIDYLSRGSNHVGRIAMPNRIRFRRCLAATVLAAIACGFGIAGDAHAAETPEKSDPPDAYELTIRLTGKDVELEGNVAGDEARAAIAAAASTAFPDLPLTMVLIDNSAAPAGFTKAAVKAIGLLSLLAEGEASVSNTQVIFSGSRQRYRVVGRMGLRRQHHQWPRVLRGQASKRRRARMRCAR